MSTKIFGAVLIIAGCGGVGFALSGNYLRQERALEQLLKCLQWMHCQLEYAMPPLAQLCRGAAKACTGPISMVMAHFSEALDQQQSSEVSACMATAILAVKTLPESAAIHLDDLGTSLGQFDLQGQLSGLESAITKCRNELETIRSGKENRTRTYRTLGLCAGAALVILLI